MILKPFLRHFEIRNDTSSQIGCGFEVDVCILKIRRVKEKDSASIYTIYICSDINK